LVLSASSLVLFAQLDSELLASGKYSSEQDAQRTRGAGVASGVRLAHCSLRTYGRESSRPSTWSCLLRPSRERVEIPSWCECVWSKQLRKSSDSCSPLCMVVRAGSRQRTTSERFRRFFPADIGNQALARPLSLERLASTSGAGVAFERRDGPRGT